MSVLVCPHVAVQTCLRWCYVDALHFLVDAVVLPQHANDGQLEQNCLSTPCGCCGKYVWRYRDTVTYVKRTANHLRPNRRQLRSVAAQSPVYGKSTMFLSVSMTCHLFSTAGRVPINWSYIIEALRLYSVEYAELEHASIYIG